MLLVLPNAVLPVTTASAFWNETVKIVSKPFLIVSVRTYVPDTIATPSTIANAVRSARSFRPARPLSATLITGIPRQADILLITARISAGSLRARSSAIKPSLRKRIRSAIAAAAASCVTITVVCP